MKKVYLVGSLSDTMVPLVANYLRSRGYDAFDSWYAAGPEADMKHYEWARNNGWSLAQTLSGHAAQNIFRFDTHHIQTSQAVVSVGLPGKSASWELGFAHGMRIPTYIFHYKGADPDRLDVMLAGCKFVFTLDELDGALR